MAFERMDFTASLAKVGVQPADIARVLRAWGESGGGSEWSGGFTFALKDGRYAYLSGWCDYTGWGCQDGADLRYFDHEPSDYDLRMQSESEETGGPWLPEKDASWEIEPADLNRWLAAGAPDD
jgi:hypothetical protein